MGLVWSDRRETIHEMAGGVWISYDSCRAISIEDLGMMCALAKPLLQLIAGTERRPLVDGFWFVNVQKLVVN
jgi:hypothetical protein